MQRSGSLIFSLKLVNNMCIVSKINIPNTLTCIEYFFKDIIVNKKILK